MISISEAISDLLFVRDTVVVPGLGAFVKKPVPAKVNPVANYFTMPTSLVSFDANLREDNDLVIRYLSEKNGISEEEARKQLSMFVSDCFSMFKNKKKVTLYGIGTLSYDCDDNITFEQDKSFNYNADAFGLSDFSVAPILRSKTKDEIKTEIKLQQIDKNTPITVDEKAVHEEDDGITHRPRWIWAAVLLLLFVSAALLHLRFNSDALKKDPQEGRITQVTPVDTITQSEAASDSLSSGREEAIGDIRIIAGCYDQEEFAERMVNSLKNKGFNGALMEKRGERWFVSFGRYVTEEEAVSALREIRANTEYKAWILK